MEVKNNPLPQYEEIHCHCLMKTFKKWLHFPKNLTRKINCHKFKDTLTI